MYDRADRPGLTVTPGTGVTVGKRRTEAPVWVIRAGGCPRVDITRQADPPSGTRAAA
jgi:hypothetical protein